MTDAKKIEKLLNKLEKFWKKNTDLRLSQIIVNAAKYSGHPPCLSAPSVYYRTDEEVEKALDAWLRK